MTVLTFKNVTFEYNFDKPIVCGASFSIPQARKLALMGQNGAGKTTIFNLILGKITPDEGRIVTAPKTTIAIARQIIPRDELSHSLRDFFQSCFRNKIYDLDPRIDNVLKAVNFTSQNAKPTDDLKSRTIGSFSGGQQARLLLAQALIQEPDILLLDEPTNNLDQEGVSHLAQFLKDYQKTVIVISHDADFLNIFTHGVLYLNTQNHLIEKYDGNYKDMVDEITSRVEKEQRKNVRLEKNIKDMKEKANFFSHKGGNMRAVAKRMREKAEEYEENKVDVRKEDKTIRPFIIPTQDGVPVDVLTITSYKIIRAHKPKDVSCNLTVQRGKHLQITGPNGIGKTTLLEKLASGNMEGAQIAKSVRVGYYRQDFSILNHQQTISDYLMSAMEEKREDRMRSVAAGFLFVGDSIYLKIGSLSEGQKGLMVFAYLQLLRPGLLILDEPTNHINYRHIPVLAKALHEYKGTMLLVSHVPEFVSQIRIDTVLDLEKTN